MTPLNRIPLFRKRWFQVLSILLGVGILITGYYAYHIWSAAHKLYDPTTQVSDKRSNEVQFDRDPISLLIIGIDERPGDKGRADSLILVTLNPHKQTVMLTNIPRDTWVHIPGRQGHDKINHSYAFGGVPLTEKAVEEFLNIPIDGYVKLNMPGLEKVVNELGGVNVHVPFTFTHGGYTFTKGTMSLNGKQALAFARMRKTDPKGDMGRIERQQELIRAMIHKSTRIESLLNIDDILYEVGSNVKTNVPPMDIFRLSRTYRNVKDDHISSNSFKGKNAYIGGIYYYKVPPAEVQRVRNILLQHLELPTSGVVRKGKSQVS